MIKFLGLNNLNRMELGLTSFVFGVLLGINIAVLGIVYLNREKETQQLVQEPKLLSVGAILPDKDGKYYAARTTLDRSLNYGNALEIYVRSQDDGQPMWGYLHIKDYGTQLRWRAIEHKFRQVKFRAFGEIAYRDRFGYIRDPNQGFFHPKKGFQGEGALNPDEYWIVVELPGYEG